MSPFRHLSVHVPELVRPEIRRSDCAWLDQAEPLATVELPGHDAIIFGITTRFSVRQHDVTMRNFHNRNGGGEVAAAAAR